jgi:UDP-N-acetylmuramyl pentapeptide phosphotransferase/UDP-N-acetylglucosamine-1-phosphate transferase
MATWVVAACVVWALMATLLTLLVARSLRALGGGSDLRADDRDRHVVDAPTVTG